jgi:outer membrane protein assembly factor BamA
LFCTSIQAQNKLAVAWHSLDHQQELLNHFKFKREVYPDTFSIISSLPSSISNMQSAGYLEASVDSIYFGEGRADLYVWIGKQYSWVQLSKGNVGDDLLSDANFKNAAEAGDVFSMKELKLLEERILRNAENKGYPFAEVRLDSVQINEGSIIANLHVDKNDLIKFDTIYINGKARIRNRFLAAYLGIKKGMVYNESTVQRITKRIGDLGFVEEEKPHKFEFYNEKAKLSLYLKNKKTSKFDFLVGFLPNSASTGKFLITGQARIDIVNPFGNGNELLIDWQKLQPRTQRLQIGLNYTYFLNLPLGFDFKFDLYKRDTLYLDLNYKAGVQYNFSGNNIFRAFYDFRSTRILNINTAQVILTRTLPQNLDTKNSLYGLEYKFDNLNYRNNPVRGIDLALSFAAGTKAVQRNTAITKLSDPVTGSSLAFLYDSIKQRNLQFQLALDVAKFWPIKKRSTILTALHSRALVAQNIYNNEKYRIGGNRLLRGFDEESIFTPWYNIATLEYRFLLSKNSYFYSFFDMGLVEDSRYGAGHIDTPFGFGAGVALETKIGVFGINYALGRQLGNNIDFKSSKIHFGYVNYF